MSPLLSLAILLLLLFASLFSGSMVAMAMALVSVISLTFFLPFPMLDTIGIILWSGTDSFLLTCIPLYLLMGYFMSNSGISKYIFDFFSVALGRLPGGVTHAVLAGTCVFGAATGSAISDAATLAVVSYPEMMKRGYDRNLTTGALAAGGTLGILMPPSMTMILYSAMTGVSLGHLFIAGVIPAILMVISFMVTTVIIVKRNKNLVPKEPISTMKQKAKTFVIVSPILVVIASVLAMIYGGITTPTEAAGVGASMVLFLTIAYRKFTFKLLKKCLLEAAVTTATIQIIVCSALIIIFFLHYHGITAMLTEGITKLPVPPIIIMILIYLLLLILGCVIESLSLIMLSTPLLYPAITALGFDPIWFGVIFVILIQIGLITPPVGLNLYMINTVCEGSSIEGIIKGSFPFLFAQISILVICTVFPKIVLWLPGKMM